MDKRYIYEERQKPGKKTTGYGTIIDTQPVVSWDNEITTVYDNKKALEVTKALNLKHDLSKLKKGSTKAEIVSLLKHYDIEI